MNLFENLQIMNETWKTLKHRQLKNSNTNLYMNGYYDNKINKYVVRIYTYRKRKTLSPKIKVDIYRFFIIPKNGVQPDNSYFVELDNANTIGEIFNILKDMENDATIEMDKTVNKPSINSNDTMYSYIP